MNSTLGNTSRATSKTVLIGLLLVGCGTRPEPTVTESQKEGTIGGGQVASQPVVPDSVDPVLLREQRLDEADRYVESGDLDKASDLLRQLLIVDPQDVEVLFRLANVRAVQGKLAEAVELLDSIPEDHPEAGLPALGQSADWYYQLGSYDEAERRYLSLLRLAPGVPMAHRRLAHLYNRQGRRHEAAEHLRELCMQGNVRQDELHALINLSDAMISEPTDASGAEVDYSPIGASGQARKLFTVRRYGEAAELLRETIAEGKAPPAIIAFYGRSLAEAQDDPSFLRWLSTTDESTRKFSEYWAAVGAYLASQQQHEAAIRALLEAVNRDPTDFLSINRLLQTFKALNQPELYDAWKQRWTSLNGTVTANNKIPDTTMPNVAAMDELASYLYALDRRVEAILWKSLETHYRGLPPAVMEDWQRQLQEAVSNGSGFPDLASRLCGMNLDAYPLPEIKIAAAAQAASDPQPATTATAHPAAFRNVSDQTGLVHRYRVSPDDRESGFTMYQQTGGGVAVLDYDRDGKPDLYLAQGAADPPGFIAEDPNQLLRSVGGKFHDHTREALREENRFTIGCTAGDWNQDGFDDVVVANIGFNQLLINNGDGTFRSIAIAGSDSLERMPSSVALGDLNGDQLPDLFEVNYIQDPEIAKTPNRDEQGNVLDPVGPGDFSPAPDRIGLNDGKGGVNWKDISDQAADAYTGLGVVIADFNSDGQNDVFVGNDKQPNQMWVRDPSGERWSEVAAAGGSAYSFRGASTASMGIAAGDFDRSGTLDLHITNFQDEPVCLYLNQGSYFQDRAAQYGLDQPSRSVLGFGSQPIDYDNDGRLDLVVTNGHIEDSKTFSGEFRQPPQLFSNLDGKFALTDVVDPSGYWSRKHLGRALARLDFDQDGKNDFVVTHLGEDSALMRNETPSTNHWLQLELVGVRSERNAVGAKVTASVGERQLTEWITGGDGYLCRNEAVISFGLGDAASVDQILIQWPGGGEQRLKNVRSDQRMLVIEGTDEPFPPNET